MPFSSSNTGSTDLRETEVQQPNTAATLSTLSSARAFSANSGQLEAGSTTTGSSLRPSSPPLAFCSAISISMTSLSVVSLIAMVPESECRMPTLMGAPVSGAGAAAADLMLPGAARNPAAAAASPAPRAPRLRRPMAIRPDVIRVSSALARRRRSRITRQTHAACQGGMERERISGGQTAADQGRRDPGCSE